MSFSEPLVFSGVSGRSSTVSNSALLAFSRASRRSKSRPQCEAAAFLRVGGVRLESGAEVPNLLAHPLLGGAIVVGEGVQFVHKPFGVHPAERMAAHGELPGPAFAGAGSAAQHHGIAQEVVRVDAAHDCAFGGDLDWIGCGRQFSKAKPVKMRLPGGLIGKRGLGLFGQSRDQVGGQRTVAHVIECRGVQHEVGMAGTQQIEEVQPALRWPGAEPEPAPAKAGVNRSLPICVQKPFLTLCRAPVSSTDIQGDVRNPARSTSRASASTLRRKSKPRSACLTR